MKLNVFYWSFFECEVNQKLLKMNCEFSQSLAVDVRRLNVSLLLWFGDGVAAALGVPAGQVDISRLSVRLRPPTSLPAA